jgi:hypothetical protein
MDSILQSAESIRMDGEVLYQDNRRNGGGKLRAALSIGQRGKKSRLTGLKDGILWLRSGIFCQKKAEISICFVTGKPIGRIYNTFIDKELLEMKGQKRGDFEGGGWGIPIFTRFGARRALDCLNP